MNPTPSPLLHPILSIPARAVSLSNRLSKFPCATHFANESRQLAITLLLPNQLSPQSAGQDHWVQLSPFGDFGNTTGATRIIQRFRNEDARRICDEFNSPIRRLTQPLGMPFYIGHPDHPRFKGQPGHEDTRAYGRGKEMQVRHDPACSACASFANATSDTPCQDHGLFVRMHWNDDGARLISNESFHGHSVNWAAIPDGMESGTQVFRPVRVKSAGFTNEPNIPVRPASLANSSTSDNEPQPIQYIVPPALKLLAGFKEDEDVTMDQVIAALEKVRPVNKSNESTVAALEHQLANERRARATIVVDSLIKAGRVVTKDRAACIGELCNAGDQFDSTAATFSNARPAIKTQPKSAALANHHARVIEGERERTARLQELMDLRQKDFPNESYEDRFRAVAISNEGAQLFAQMQRSGSND